MAAASPVLDAARRRDSRQAWRVATGAFLAMFVTLGVLFSFGSFAGPIAAELGSSGAEVGAVFSVTTALFFALGAASGPAVDRWGPRPVLSGGTLAFAAGLVATSRASSLQTVILAHGLGLGVAAACTFVPLVATVTSWFHERRNLAVGLAVSGIGVGTLVGAPAAAQLISAFGWRQAYLAIAAGGSLLLVLSILAVASPPATSTAAASTAGTSSEPRPSTPAYDLVGAPEAVRESLRSRDYRLLYAAQLLLAMSMFVPFVSLTGAAQARGMSSVHAAGLVGLIGAASLVGRIALAPVAARIGLLNTYRACFFAMAASFLAWLAGPVILLPLHAAIFGIGYGGFAALGAPLLAQRFGVPRLGRLLGILYTSSAIGSSAGPVLAGVLIDRYGYDAAALFALVLGLAAATVLLAVRVPVPRLQGAQA